MTPDKLNNSKSRMKATNREISCLGPLRFIPSDEKHVVWLSGRGGWNPVKCLQAGRGYNAACCAGIAGCVYPLLEWYAGSRGDQARIGRNKFGTGAQDIDVAHELDGQRDGESACNGIVHSRVRKDFKLRVEQFVCLGDRQND